MKKYLIAIAFFVAACRPDTPSITALESAPQTTANRFVCDGNVSHCELSSGELASAPGIDATWNVTYDFPCTVGGEKNVSTIEVRVGDGAHRLVYGDRSSSFALSGTGKLKLADTDSAMTRSWFFDYAAGCGLTFKFSATPSSQQVATWTQLSNTYTDVLNSNLKIYSYKASVAYWEQQDIANPAGTTATLEQIISSLKDAAENDEALKLYAFALQQIHDGVPHASIFGPFETAKGQLQTYLAKANALSALQTSWNAKVTATLKTAITNAAAALH